MPKAQNTKKYDLEDRTYNFARIVRDFIKKLNRTNSNVIYISQLIRSSSSIGANFIEASEAISKKDFFHRIKICRKEAKETRYWLMLVDIDGNLTLQKESNKLIQEANELMKIFGAIVSKQ
ncbi:four helix bundle protein [Candidatus Roizmanbacteria bacterium RIFCSPHIGHO2_12_FULL_33_9]|uniref:Four helix bundle protein n=1 Tax=Candidatus Roizmanbacteria bacterium RIFCSPHIGHO2_12_FULL_33_9 TaxID=1802045 RepID=A0A1F7HJK4_9BACT|nr:MAG: four helix bundle protein [Candidatus Roizmanbacteria bacterium RIFCSPHIGHO2_12_FULL_33_9]